MSAQIHNNGDKTQMRGTIEKPVRVETRPTEHACHKCGAKLGDEVTIGSQGSQVRRCSSCGLIQRVA